VTWHGDDPEDDSVPLRSALDRLLEVRGLEATAQLADVTAVWDEVAGPAAAHVSPRTFRGDELVVEVDHPAWATEVQISSGDLLARLSDRLGRRAPTRLSVRVVPPGRARRG
jgi:predicted nucleic acid-binding Zn ribbon protein